MKRILLIVCLYANSLYSMEDSKMNIKDINGECAHMLLHRATCMVQCFLKGESLEARENFSLHQNLLRRFMTQCPGKLHEHASNALRLAKSDDEIASDLGSKIHEYKNGHLKNSDSLYFSIIQSAKSARITKRMLMSNPEIFLDGNEKQLDQEVQKHIQRYIQ